MLSPEYLNSISYGLFDLYSQLEQDILEDMVRRFIKIGKSSESTDYLAKIFQELGGLKQDINKYVSKFDKQTEIKLKSLFYEALEKSANNDFERLNNANLSDAQRQILNATVKKVAHSGIVNGSKKVKEDAEKGFIKCFSGIQRVTMTIADSVSNAFVQEANRQYMKVATGSFSYKDAILQGVQELAQKGITTVTYTDSGKERNYSIESMLRTNIMTGINQTSTQITLDNCSDLNCELVEVDAHSGSRPTHEAWQGKIYSLNPDNEKYPYFYDVCQYGQVDGICGINCRHSFYPYFEGEERLYSNSDLQKMKGETFEYKYKDKTGKEKTKKMTQYEAEQMQRGIERDIRKAKIEIVALEKVDKTATETIKARNKLYSLQEKQRDFINQTGLKRDYSRETIGTKDGKQPKGLKRANENNNDKKYYGAYYGGILDKSSEKQEEYAKIQYTTYRNRKSKSDINKISNNTGIEKEKIAIVRSHIFENIHSFDNKKLAQFDPSPIIALSWERLEHNKFTKDDILLLNHEYVEALFMEKKGYSYEKAHLLANLRYPWQYKKEGFSNDKIYKITRDEYKNYLQISFRTR